MRLQVGRIGQDDGAVDGVLQLADVARPVEGAEHGDASPAPAPATRRPSSRLKRRTNASVSEEIITALARFKNLFVIASNSSFTYRNRSVDIKQVARELGVRYVLEGSVRKAADRVRITGQLIVAETGRHIWTERFDRQLEDIFDLQDEISENIVGAVEPKSYPRNESVTRQRTG